MKKRLWTFIIIPILLFVISAALFLSFHGYGAWGGDGVGYIYPGAQVFRGEELVFQDEIAKDLAQNFDIERVDDDFTPSRYTLLNQDGFLMNRYPVGMALLLGVGAKIAGNVRGMYSVVPILAALNVMCVYYLAVLMFKKVKFKSALGLIAAITYGFGSFIWGYALAQPMTETASVTFLLYTAIILWIVSDKFETKPLPALCLSGLAGLLFGFSLNIRHPNAIFIGVVIAIAAFCAYNMRKKKKSAKYIVFMVLTSSAIFVLLAGVGFLPAILNNQEIDTQRDPDFISSKYGQEDSALSNQFDSRGLRLSNFFHSEGRFEPERGSFEVLFNDVVFKFIAFPAAFFFFVFGLVISWFKSKKAFTVLIVWFSSFLLLYSFWVNPYYRYLIPAFPALAIGFAAGLYFAMKGLRFIIDSHKLFGFFIFLVAVLLIVSTYPVALEAQKKELNSLTYKAISEADYDTIELLPEIVGENSIIFYVKPDEHYRGLATNIEAQTEIPFRIAEFTIDSEEFRKLEESLDQKEIYIWVDNKREDALPEKESARLEIIQEFDFDFNDYSATLYRLNPL